jgi:hypothetical protein
MNVILLAGGRTPGTRGAMMVGRNLFWARGVRLLLPQVESCVREVC